MAEPALAHSVFDAESSADQENIGAAPFHDLPTRRSSLGSLRNAASSVPIALERAARSHPGLFRRTRKDRARASIQERVREATALGRNRYRGYNRPSRKILQVLVEPSPPLPKG